MKITNSFLRYFFYYSFHFDIVPQPVLKHSPRESSYPIVLKLKNIINVKCSIFILIDESEVSFI